MTTPPLTDVQAERSVLGAMLLSLQACAEVRETLPSGDAFWLGKHRTIYEAVCGLLDADKPVDAVTVMDELDRRGWLEDVGGAVYLTDIANATPEAASASHYADIVADLHRRRTVLKHTEEVAQRVLDRKTDVDDVVGDGVDRLLSAGAGESGLVTVTAAADRIRHMWREGLPPGPETGWDSVDQLYRPAMGQWTVVTGIPGMGKSTWLDNLLVNMARAHGHRFALFSPESAPVERHVANIISCAMGAPFNPESLSEERLSDAMAWVDKHFLWVDPSEAASLRGVLSRFAAANAARPLDGIVIDPWNELEAPPGLNMSETLWVSVALTMLRRAARKMGVHAWLVAHPTKLYKVEDHNTGKVRYPVPTPYDISGSAHWRNKADFAVTVHREDVFDPSNVTQLHVQKVRFREHGTPGRVDLIYDPNGNRYNTLRDAA